MIRIALPVVASIRQCLRIPRNDNGQVDWVRDEGNLHHVTLNTNLTNDGRCVVTLDATDGASP